MRRPFAESLRKESSGLGCEILARYLRKRRASSEIPVGMGVREERRLGSMHSSEHSSRPKNSVTFFVLIVMFYASSSSVDHESPDFAERMIFAIAEWVVASLREPVTHKRSTKNKEDER